MKYIIDLPDEHESDYIAETPSGKRLFFPLRITDITYSLPTHLHVEEYTEPDRKAIEDEVWDFVNTVYGLSDEELYEIFYDGNYCEHSYQEAKAKYDSWKKRKDEIRVGDEITCGDTNGVVVGIDTTTEDSGVNVVCRDGNTDYIGMAYVIKTGRHFDEVERLLERIREQE